MQLNKSGGDGVEGPSDSNAFDSDGSFRALFEGLPIPSFEFDVTGSIIKWNAAFAKLFLNEKDKHPGLVQHLLTPQFAQDELDAVVGRVYAGQSVSGLSLNWGNGSDTKFFDGNCFPVFGPEGTVSSAFFTCIDLTFQKRYEAQVHHQMLRINEYSVEIEQRKWELEEANARLEALASTDGLTGVLNHRAFQEALCRDYARASREGVPLSLVLIDIDHFKSYNDSFGHPAGDALLKRFAEALVGCCRESDLVARYGGEEFVAILPATDLSGAIYAAERMRAAVEALPNDLRKVTASFGVSTFPITIGGPDLLIAAADRALYMSKSSGRNRVTHAHSLEQAA